jgi:uncharacterized protein (DUF1015 family)
MPTTVVPFAGLRFSPYHIPDLSVVMTPPYDVIRAEERQRYLASHPYNMIHLILGAEHAGDTATENRFTRAATYLRHWCDAGVLVREAQPALYLYQQDFVVNAMPMRRHGFICRLRLEDYEARIVLPHEATLAGPKADLLRLWQACQANLSPVFAVYLDTAKTLDTLFAPLFAQSPQRDVAHWGEGRHRLWVMTDPVLVASVQQHMREHSLVIADGHHRYETALALRDVMRQQHPHADAMAAYEYIMMYCANVDDPGLIVFPTHRLMQHLPLTPLVEALQRLNEWVRVEVDTRQTESLEQWQARLVARLQACHGPDSVFALYAGGDHCCIVTVTAAAARQRVRPASASDAWKQLDVSVLHHALLPALQTLQPDTQPTITYAGVGDEVLPAVARGAYDLAVLMRPTSLQQMVTVALGGERLPPKSTFFYPKLPTGLVINGFD